MAASTGLAAADANMQLGPGATRDEVIRTFGLPTAQSKVGEREILKYPEGQITLERGRVTQVEIRGVTPPRPSVARPAVVEPPPPTPVAPPPQAETSTPVAPIAVSSSLLSAGGLVLAAVAGAVIAVALVLWLVWRSWGKPAPRGRERSIAERIAEAASGVPTREDILVWRKEYLSGVVARLAESQGYSVSMQPAGSDKDITLRRPAETKPCAFVFCMPGSAGVARAKRLREFVGMLAVEGVLDGWFVAPAGFASDARIYAEERTLQLIDAEHLVAQLRDLPPFVLSRVLGQGS